MTHDDLVQLAANWLVSSRRCEMVLTEYRMHMNQEQPDAIGWKPDGTSFLIECKTSRGDFLADRKKVCRHFGQAMGEYRYFLCPKGLIKPDEVPEGWGLIYAYEGRARITKKPDRQEDFNSNAERKLLINALRRASNYQVQPTFPKVIKDKREI